MDDLRIQALKARLRLASLIHELVGDERWEALVGEVKKSLRNAFTALLNHKLPLDELRWWQGYYTALTIISQNKVANSMDLEAMRKELEEAEKTGELRQMLDAGNLPDNIMQELLDASNFLNS